MFTKHPAAKMSSRSNCCTVRLSCQLKQKASWETAIAKGQQHTQAEDRKALILFFFSVFIVLFSCVDKHKEQKETGRGKEEGLNSRAFTVQMFTIPIAM